MYFGDKRPLQEYSKHSKLKAFDSKIMLEVFTMDYAIGTSLPSLYIQSLPTCDRDDHHVHLDYLSFSFNMWFICDLAEFIGIWLK